MSNEKRTDKETNRRHFSPEQKVKILRLHLLEKVPVSEICEKHRITPTQFYQWQKIFFENGASTFVKSSGPRALTQAEQRARALENKLQRAVTMLGNAYQDGKQATARIRASVHGIQAAGQLDADVHAPAEPLLAVGRRA